MCDKSKPWLSALCTGIAAISIFAAGEFSHAHGEDKPGPHGGVIRMPGAFHTELVTTAAALNVYLLDINWKNPTTKESSVSASVKIDSNNHKLLCKGTDGKFVCSLPRGVKLNRGELKVSAVREKIVGADMTYSLPLEIPKSGAAEHH